MGGFSINNVYAHMIGNSTIYVSYEISNSEGEKENDYQFFLQSNFRDGVNFEDIICESGGYFFILDMFSIKLSHQDALSFRVIARKIGASSPAIESCPVSLNVCRENPTANALRQIYANYGSGISKLPFLYFRLKRTGFYCSACRRGGFTETATKSNCVVCYGTGYDGGYYSPIKIYAVVSQNVSAKTSDEGFVTDLNMWEVKTGSPPLFVKGDILYDIKRNKLFLVGRVTVFESRGDAYAQAAVCTEIAKTNNLNRLLSKHSDISSVRELAVVNSTVSI